MDKELIKKYRDEMVCLYKTFSKDWMGFNITSNNPLTLHHIKKREYGGEDDIDNLALLTEKAHRLLHKIENDNPEIYCTWSAIFRTINDSKAPITKGMRIAIDKFKKQTKNFNNSIYKKGKRKK